MAEGIRCLPFHPNIGSVLFSVRCNIVVCCFHGKETSKKRFQLSNDRWITGQFYRQLLWWTKNWDLQSPRKEKKKTKTKNVNFFIQKPSGFCLSAWKHNEINTKVTLEHYNDMCYILIRMKDRHWQCNREFWYSLAREMPVNFISGMVQPLYYTSQIQMTEVD